MTKTVPSSDAGPAPEKDLSEQIKVAFGLIRQAAATAASTLRQGEDNPAITRQPGAKSFTMSSANLGMNWTPFFHDWAGQYSRIADLVEAQRFRAVASLLETGMHREQNLNAERFAPEVIKRCKEILGDLPGSMSAYQLGEEADSAASPERKRAARP